MRYTKAVEIKNAAASELKGLHPGQWIIMEGVRGRFMGFNGRSVWVAWGSTASKRFKLFAQAYHKNKV